ncbi:hypothetical protein A5806_002628 [Enterococcus faecium]|uniref:hypothetical protein n=1 Tax=Enterococcus faecium TaxID=1352 RepID=UPI000B3E5D81|nr:hypothetical protein [Enterococcus faecium]OUZ28019.1 hypothetical protein A5806_002628 [Enterococcus faecium]
MKKNIFSKIISTIIFSQIMLTSSPLNILADEQILNVEQLNIEIISQNNDNIHIMEEIRTTNNIIYEKNNMYTNNNYLENMDKSTNIINEVNENITENNSASKNSTNNTFNSSNYVKKNFSHAKKKPIKSNSRQSSRYKYLIKLFHKFKKIIIITKKCLLYQKAYITMKNL